MYRKLDETAAIQRQREQESEERRAREKADRETLKRAPVVEVASTDSGEATRRWAPPTARGGGWRDRVAAKGGDTDPTPPVNGSGAASTIAPTERRRLNVAPRTAPIVREDAPPPPQAVPVRGPATPVADGPSVDTPKPGVYRPGALSGRKLQAERPASPVAGADPDKPTPKKYVPPTQRGAEGASGGGWGRRS